MDSIHVYQKIEPRILVQGEKANITTCRSLKQTNKQTFWIFDDHQNFL